MPIFTKRKERETVGAFLRRFSRRMQQSGVLLEARKRKHYLPGATKRQKRLSALYRIQKTKEMERLRKLGLLEESVKTARRR